MPEIQKSVSVVKKLKVKADKFAVSLTFYGVDLQYIGRQ